jgi:PAS domain S-box-containing protein
MSERIALEAQPAKIWRLASRQIARWNSRMREMLGVVADPDDSSWTSTVTGDEEKDVEKEYSRLLSGEITQLSERRMLTRPDGKKIWADLSTALVRDRDEQPLAPFDYHRGASKT